VFDASALLALLNGESGEARVAEALSEGAVMGTVNLSEVVAKLAEVGMTRREVREALDPLGIDFVPFAEEHAYTAGLLRPATRAEGLSLGDRACLALASREGVPALTTDRRWSRLTLDPPVKVVEAR
jgi:PIN domain nuclease of toxin-antitoxin system